MEVVPCTISAAKDFVTRLHRHNKAPQGALFAVGAASDGVLVAVAIIGRPIARMLDDGKTCEVTRLCTDGTRNACSILYGASARAAKALGWSRIVTYTLQEELGASLKASGWSRDASVPAASTWSRPSRSRNNDDRPAGPKVRWSKTLTAPTPKD